MSGCPYGFDADDVARALQGETARDGTLLDAAHVASCASCRHELALLETARAAWGGAREDDDRSRAVFRERRLVHGIPRPRRHVSWGTFARVALAAFALVFVVAVRPWRFVELFPAPSVAPFSSPIASSGSSRPSSASGSVASSPSSSSSAAPPSAEPVVVVRESSGTISPAVHAGDRLPRKVHVGAQARLTLAWSFALDSTAEIAGPADLAVVGEPASAVRIEEGHAIVSADSDFEICTTEVSMHGRGATWDVDAGAGWTHVKARAGLLTVRGKGSEQVLRAGDETRFVEATSRKASLEPEAPRRPSDLEAPPNVDVDPSAEFAEGVASLGAGDRVDAERRFRLVADAPRAPDALRQRAAFRWAELVLARGDSERARGELTGLLAAPDPALAADAAFLLARSTASPSDRADVWRRYLVRRPSAPYREDAVLEEASALVAAGRKTEADTALDDLWTDPDLTKVQGARLRSIWTQIRP